jgi:hypothetical protein
MTTTITDFRKIEDGIMLLLDQEFGERNSDKVEDFLNGLRLYLKDRVKIQGVSPADELVFEYPKMTAPLFEPKPRWKPKNKVEETGEGIVND